MVDIFYVVIRQIEREWNRGESSERDVING
jgi:hypothetical protein